MIKTIRIVYDLNGTKILEIPIDTSLDNIIADLWSGIIKYMDYHPFIISNADRIIPGYRSIRKEEFNGKKFTDHYFENGGIANMIEFKVLMNSCLTVERKFIVCDYDTNPVNSKIWISLGKTPIVILNSDNGFNKNSHLKISNQNAQGDKKFNVTIMVPNI